MFKVIELSTGTVLASLETMEQALSYISDVESSDVFAELLNRYGSVRRVQQEIVVVSE